MSRIVESEAQARAADRLLAAQGGIYAAFDGLGLGFDHNDALEYLRGAPSFAQLPRREQGRVAGLVMGFALVVAESVASREAPESEGPR